MNVLADEAPDRPGTAAAVIRREHALICIPNNTATTAEHKSKHRNHKTHTTSDDPVKRAQENSIRQISKTKTNTIPLQKKPDINTN